MSREGFIKSAIGVCYQNLKKFELAEQYLSEGIQKEQDKMIRLSFMDRLALLYYEFGYYEKCIDECTAILEEDSVYYPAYLRRQQAAFELQDGQQVIDDYYNAVRIYPSYYKPYLLAVQVFCIYHQYEDARKVLKLAQEQEVHQELLSFFEIRVMRHLARTEEESRSVLELCHNLQKELAQKEEEHAILKKDSDKTEVELLDDDMKRDGMPKDVVNEEELQFEEILLYMDSNQTDRALQVTDAVIQQGSQNVRFRWVRADIYRIRKEYRKALSEYDDLKKEVAASSEIEFNRGICLQKLGKVQEAILAFRTTLELNPKHPRAHHELMKIYSQMYDRYELKTAYGNALKEITAQLELVPDAYYYIERGLLYMDNYNFEPARKDYEKALELEPDNIYAYNNIGYVYQAQKEFQKALQYYEKSMECMKEERTMLPYTNAAKCYEALRQWDQAVDVLMKALEVFGPSRSIYSQLVKIYTCKRDTAMVTQWCEKAVQQKLMSKPDYYDKLSRIYFVTGRLEEGKKILTLWNNWVEAHWDNNHPRWQYMCDVSEAWGVYYRYHRELKRAIRYLENAWKIERKHGLSYIRTGIHLSNAYYASKQWKKAYAVAKETMNYMITSNHIPLKLKEAEPENPETIQSYLSYRPLAPLRMFEAAQLYISMGELDKAERLLHQCQQVPRCRHCEFGECCDGRMIQAFLEELKGNEKEAIRLYEIAQQIDPSDIEPALALDALRNKKGG
jgi:tetratricopeptide (TPR) repeat protein